MQFEIKKRDAAGRICSLKTRHGTVTTPTLLPVINPNKMIISPKEMKRLFGTEIVITNSYIIRKYEDLRTQALAEGVHKLIDFDGPIMTDSGTFQSYVYGDVNIDPLEIVTFQRDIDVDIGTILDVFGTPDQTRTEAKRAVDITVERAKNSVPLKDQMLLACPVQGSVFPGLRSTCAEELGKLDADIHPIGGVVPLMEQQRYLDLTRVILASKKGLPVERPVHLFGAGHPLIFPLAVALGCDMFDSSAYIKYALEDRMIFPGGTSHLQNLEEIPCCCPVCSSYTASELKQVEKTKRIRLLAEHNLYVSFEEIRKIRNAISEGILWELVEQKATENPLLHDAMVELKRPMNNQWLEQFEPMVKNRALFYTGHHTVYRPDVSRMYDRLLQWYQPSSDVVVLLPESVKPYHVSYEGVILDLLSVCADAEVVVDSVMGPVPIAVDEVYPFAQSVFPLNVDKDTKQVARKRLSLFLKGKKMIRWKGKSTLKGLEKYSHDILPISQDERRIHAVATMQFGPHAANTLFDGTLRIVKSKNTGKIRNVYCNDEHVVSMRASDGLFTLKRAGAIRLHKCFSSPRFRVIVEADAASFVKQGKSVFAKFVHDADSSLRPFDECIIVDRNDEFLSVGRCLLNRLEMLSFRSGQAVKTREHDEP
ncbi:MAG: tRNA guanosine(15) transglycosylase TgtA [Thermoplasmatota archaeon]